MWYSEFLSFSGIISKTRGQQLDPVLQEEMEIHYWTTKWREATPRPQTQHKTKVYNSCHVTSPQCENNKTLSTGTVSKPAQLNHSLQMPEHACMKMIGTAHPKHRNGVRTKIISKVKEKLLEQNSIQKEPLHSSLKKGSCARNITS